MTRYKHHQLKSTYMHSALDIFCLILFCSV